ncbi:MAG: PAS domain S-box protein, partial [Terriglobia bacterium]
MAQYSATRVLAEAATLSEATPKILQAICESLGWKTGIFWAVDADAQALRYVSAWRTPGAESAVFLDDSQQTTLGWGIGLPGRVWERAQPYWIRDVLEDSNFPRVTSASQSGLHGAFAFPVFASSEVLGVMEFFSRKNEQPDEALLEMFAAVGSQIGQYMERQQAAEEHRQAEERTRLIIETALDAVVTMDERGIITDWNGEAERVFGWTSREAMGLRMSETLIPPNYRDAHERGLRKFLETGQGPVLNQRIEITAVRRDGRQLPVELAICPSRLGGQWTFSAFIRDITRRKKTEKVQAAIYQCSEAAHAAQYLQDLFGSVHRIIGELMPARNLYIALHDETKEMISFPYFTNERDAPQPPRKLQKGLSEYILRTGKPLLVTPEIFQGLFKAGEIEQIGTPCAAWVG